jgi:hypothetical protein
MLLYGISKKVPYVPVYYIILYSVVSSNIYWGTKRSRSVSYMLLFFVSTCVFVLLYIYIQGEPKVCIQYIVYKWLYTYFWPTLYISLACSTNIYSYILNLPYVYAKSESPKMNVYANYIPKARLLLIIYFIQIIQHLTTNNFLRISLFRFLYATVLISIGHNGFHHTPFT